MGRYVDACARKNMKPPKGKGGCSRSNKVTVAVRRSPDVASPASRRSASRAAGRSTQARAAASLVHAAIGAGVPGLAWLVLVIAMTDFQRRPGSILYVGVLAHSESGASAAARPGAEPVPDEDSVPVPRA